MPASYAASAKLLKSTSTRCKRCLENGRHARGTSHLERDARFTIHKCAQSTAHTSANEFSSFEIKPGLGKLVDARWSHEDRTPNWSCRAQLHIMEPPLLQQLRLGLGPDRFQTAEWRTSR